MASFVTLASELGRRGYRALEADLVPGLAARLNADGAVVGDGSLEPIREPLAMCFWGWSGSRLDNVLDQLGSDGMLLGIAVNQWEFIERLDRLVLLELDQETQRRRASSRDRLFGSRSRMDCPCSGPRCSRMAQRVSMQLKPRPMSRRP